MLMLAGWINRHQQAVIAYQREEIKVLREMLGGKRLRFTDEQRRSPNLNAFIERFIRSIKEECLDRVIPPGEAHLRHLIHGYIAHYHVERPHQGLGGAMIQPANDQASDGRLVRRERLGGLLNYYYREAA